VATWNVCDATNTKLPLILHSLDQHAIDICLLTETKWTYATSDWFIDDSLWEAYRVDFLDTSITQVPLNKLRRGGLCLLVNKGIQARVQLLDHSKQDGPLTTTQWRISTGAWEYNLVLAGVYRSPNTTDTAPLKDQFETIERQMMPVP
jgi:hypothetical protein